MVLPVKNIRGCWQLKVKLKSFFVQRSGVAKWCQTENNGEEAVKAVLAVEEGFILFYLSFIFHLRQELDRLLTIFTQP